MSGIQQRNMQRKELDCISRRQCLRLGLCGQLHLPWWPQCWGDVHSDSPGLLEDMLLMLFSTWEVFSSIYCSWSETFWNFPLTAPNITILRVWLHAAVYRKYFWPETFSLGSGKLLKELFFLIVEMWIHFHWTGGHALWPQQQAGCTS